MNTYLQWNKKQYSFLMSLVLILILFFPIVSLAEESELNFQVQPKFPDSQIEGSTSYFDLNLEPGTTDNLGLIIRNTAEKEITIKVTAHTAFTNVNGVVEYGKEAEEKDPTIKYAMEELIKTPKAIVLAAGEERAIDLPITMPEESIEGLLAGGIRIEEVLEETENEENGQGLAIKNQFSFILGVLVSNNRSTVVPELELLDVFADQLNYRNVFSATIQNFTPTFVNQLEVEAVIRAKGETDILYKSLTDGMQMAPNSHFNYPIPLNGDAFRNGNYVASLTARSGEHEWKWEKEFTINQETARRLNREDVTVDTSTNWWMIVAASLILLLGLLIIFLFYQKKKREREHRERQARIARRRAQRRKGSEVNESKKN